MNKKNGSDRLTLIEKIEKIESRIVATETVGQFTAVWYGGPYIDIYLTVDDAGTLAEYPIECIDTSDFTASELDRLQYVARELALWMDENAGYYV